MSRRPSPSRLESPFLQSVSVIDERIVDGEFPFTLPVFGRGDFQVEIDSPLTVIVGENGAGKSTLLEAIAEQCGFALGGGTRDHRYRSAQSDAPLAKALRLSWRQKRSQGFFVRAESFFNLSSYLEEVDAKATPDGGSLHHRSHGEAFMAFFGSRMRPGGIYLMDEPEAALSPTRQIELAKLILQVTADREAQVILATHSPILMACSGGEVLYMTPTHAGFRPYVDTPHFQIYLDLMRDPERLAADLRDGIL